MARPVHEQDAFAVIVTPLQRAVLLELVENATVRGKDAPLVASIIGSILRAEVVARDASPIAFGIPETH